MAYLLDTDVAIHLRDGDPAVTAKVAALDDAVLMSIVIRVELDGGVYREPAHAPVQRARLDAILASAGYSRRKLLERMIAARALVHRASLVTMNSGDYADIPELALLAW